MGDPRLDIVMSNNATAKWDTLARAPMWLDLDDFAMPLIPRELIVNRPSIEMHKNILYDKSRINDIIPYLDVNMRCYQEVPIIMHYSDSFIKKRPDDRERGPSCSLVGRSGLGKTDYVRWLGDHVYFDGEISCKHINSSAKFMGFDDVPTVRLGNAGHAKQYYIC